MHKFNIDILTLNGQNNYPKDFQKLLRAFGNLLFFVILLYHCKRRYKVSLPLERRGDFIIDFESDSSKKSVNRAMNQ